MADIINEIVGSISSFARSNSLVFFVALAVLAFLIYRRPKFFLTLIFLGLLLAGVVYLILQTAASGVAKKQRLIHREVPVENIFRPRGLTL
jgi:Ca2+/Na+ antiporter